MGFLVRKLIWLQRKIKNIAYKSKQMLSGRLSQDDFHM